MQSDTEYQSMRQEDQNGYVTVRDNPIIRAGVFPYRGSQLPDGNPDIIYNVLRPLEELTKTETLESLKGLPIIDEHEMLGENYARGPEERGVHGATLENIAVSGNDILAPLRIFSKTLKSLIDSGKKGLSLGYRCRFEKSVGEFNGMLYNYIQRDIRGNHLALVSQGRNGTVVLDSSDVFDEFDINMKEFSQMADETKATTETESKETDGEKAVLTLAEVHAFMKEHAPMWQELQALMNSETSEEENAALDGDTKETTGDQKAEDEPDSEKKDMKKDDKAEDKKIAMDAAVSEAVAKEMGKFQKNALKSLRSDISARDSLAKRLEPHVGTFAHDAMDSAEVAAYGAQKLGLSVGAGEAVVAVNAYLSAAEKFKSGPTFAMDSTLNHKPKAGGKLSATLEKASA